mgnify:CR=1 FL=1
MNLNENQNGSLALNKKGVNNIKKYRVTYTKIVKGENRTEAMEEFMDFIGVENSDYANVEEFKGDVEVVRVG